MLRRGHWIFLLKLSQSLKNFWIAKFALHLHLYVHLRLIFFAFLILILKVYPAWTIIYFLLMGLSKDDAVIICDRVIHACIVMRGYSKRINLSVWNARRHWRTDKDVRWLIEIKKVNESIMILLKPFMFYALFSSESTKWFGIQHLFEKIFAFWRYISFNIT